MLLLVSFVVVWVVVEEQLVEVAPWVVVEFAAVVAVVEAEA